jgi:hypothetical protein
MGVWGSKRAGSRSSASVAGEKGSKSVRSNAYAEQMPKRPSRIDLLELDIDLRLSDLWREADEIQEWTLDVVAAFMRAAYGKGYCDSLTEDSPGRLCLDHGYRVPGQRDAERSADPS